MRVLIVTHPTPKDVRQIIDILDSDYIIAVDQATRSLYQQQIRIDLAIGDFDSLENHEVLRELNVLRLNKKKNVTDTYQALIEANKLNPEEVYLIGGIGGDRIEHFMIHTMFFDQFPKLTMKDEKSTLFLLEKGVHKVSNSLYNTFIAYPEAILSLSGFEYNLSKLKLTAYNPLCISNEVKGGNGTIEVHKGRILVVISQKEKK